ncbi:hypothetical protein HDU78_010806, partial [Chytriomyces hyalinus]
FEDGYVMPASITGKTAITISKTLATDVMSMNLANGHLSLEIDVPGFNKEDVLLSVNEHESVVILEGILKGKWMQTVPIGSGKE